MNTLSQITMDFDTCMKINSPIIFLSFMINAFYIFSLVCPLHGERIGQPLKLLLWSLICSTVTYMMSLSLMFVLGILTEDFSLLKIMYFFAECSVISSMTASVWLNFFYYTQIVPARKSSFTWIKKNIKGIIYSIWVIERFYTLFSLMADLLNHFVFVSSSNFTTNYSVFMPQNVDWLDDLLQTLNFVQKGHFFLCFCVMMKSSGSTVAYLSRHMRNMVTNGQTLFSPQLCSQVRVAVTGILQGFLYVFCALLLAYQFLSLYVGFVSFDIFVYFTFINMYMTGTTFNLGIGQAVFRRRAAHIWAVAAQWWKRYKGQI